MLIRAGKPADAEATARVHVASWAAAYTLEGPTLEQRLEQHRQFPPSFLGVGPSRDADAEGELYTIYVHPDHWGAGVGRELMRAGEERLRKAGHNRVVLWVLDGNVRAQRFYEAAGWSADGERRTIEFVGEEIPEVRYSKQL